MSLGVGGCVGACVKACVGGVVGWGVWVGWVLRRVWVCVRGCVGACGGVGSLERESIARSALLSGYLSKSGHLPRSFCKVIFR